VSEAGSRPTGVATRVPANCELTLGMTCLDRSEPGTSVWSITSAEHLANPVGMVQGGLLTAFAMVAMAAAVTDLRGPEAYEASTELKISFIRGAPISEALTCTARVIGGGRRAAFVEAEISDASDDLVAKASSTYLLPRGD
jgi:uncharacterized protein (TIGR00369 family)